MARGLQQQPSFCAHLHKMISNAGALVRIHKLLCMHEQSGAGLAQRTIGQQDSTKQFNFPTYD